MIRRIMYEVEFATYEYAIERSGHLSGTVGVTSLGKN